MRRKWGAKCHTGPSAQRDERKRFTRSRFGVRPRRCPQSPPPLKIHERPPPPYTASLVRSLLSAWASFREACAKRIRSFSLVLRCPLVLLVSQKSRVLGPPRAGGGKGKMAAETLRTIVAVTSACDVADAAGVVVHLGGSPGSLKEGVSRKGEEQGAVTSCC